MRLFQNITVRQRIFRLVALASVLAMICVAGAVVLYEARTFRPRTLEQLQNSSRLLLEVLPAALDFGGNESAAGYLKTYAEETQPAVIQAALYDNEGRLFASYAQSTNASTFPPATGPAGHRFTARELSLWQPIQRGEAVIGHLFLLKGLPPLYARLPQYSIMVGTVLLALTVVGTVLLRGVRRHFLRPLSSLVGTTTGVIQQSDYRLRAEVVRHDELGQLATAFNQMLEVIGQRDAALRHASERIQKVFNAATEIGIVSADTKGVVTVFNSGAERMLGYRAEEIVGKQTPAIWHVEEECAQRGEALTKLYGRPIQGFDVFVEPVRQGHHEAREWTFVRKDGSRFWVFLVITAMRDAAGEITGFLGMVSDITARKRAETELRRSEERFRTLIENASDMITVVNAEGLIRFQSPSSERVLGYAAGDMVGHSAFDFVHPDDLPAMRETWPQVLQNAGQVMAVEVRLRHRNGSWRLIEATARNVPEEAPDGYIILNARDVTESRKLAEQFRQAQKLEAIGQLSGGVAHDFNNLLTIIDGNVTLMRLTTGLPAELNEPITEISQATARAANLTRQLLAFSRRQTMQLKSVDLSEVVANMTRMLQRIVGEDVRVHLHYASQPALVRADVGMLEQVLLNLVVNARDAMPAGGRLIIETTIVEVTADQVAQLPQGMPGSFVCLSVSDTGCGIPPEVMPKIFEPFFTTKDVGKGTGLGLATVYGIVQQHKGWVNAYSEVGIGTTIRVLLPAHTAPTPDRANVPAKPELPAPLSAGTGGTILLVEDEPALRNLGCKVLRRLGYTVLEAPTGVAALEVWRQHRAEINLLLTDMVMPDGVSGRELAQRLHLEAPHLPVIYTSGYSAEIAGKDFPLEEGVNFLAKPFSPIVLGETVRASLAAAALRTND